VAAGVPQVLAAPGDAAQDAASRQCPAVFGDHPLRHGQKVVAKWPRHSAGRDANRGRFLAWAAAQVAARATQYGRRSLGLAGEPEQTHRLRHALHLRTGSTSSTSRSRWSTSAPPRLLGG
jgi:hypothetical protein